ncbi:MAG: hypothetical protein AUK44_06065 [Porphyromonadaceae bacterium CG2_30_38_12]|nr:MAG: hypothetical protein AUK44_06065 [Porphyromonadaceae bacterium CG2_30_38_12]
MKNILLQKWMLTVLFMACALTLFGQSSYESFWKSSKQTNQSGMIVLGSWALLNMTVGAYGWAKQTGEDKYFHQMNFFWNTVNISIAGVAIYQNIATDSVIYTANEMLQKHISTEKILLINAGLDVVYVGTGFVLRALSNKSVSKKIVLAGYGKSLLLQGAFLFLFDATMYAVMHHQRLEFLKQISAVVSSDFVGLHYVHQF